MSKAENKVNGKTTDPFACPTCEKRACSCPSGGGGADDSVTDKDKTKAEESSKAKINEASSAALQREEESSVFVPKPKPTAASDTESDIIQQNKATTSYLASLLISQPSFFGGMQNNNELKANAQNNDEALESTPVSTPVSQIGRASCRERV